MLGISNLPIDLEARMEARLQRREAEANSHEVRERPSTHQPVDVPKPFVENKDDSSRYNDKTYNQNQQPAQAVTQEMRIQTNRQVLPDLKVVIATLERALQSDRIPGSNQPVPEIIGDAEPEWITLLENILAQLKAIRAFLESDISADLAKQNPEPIFSAQRYLRKMVDGSAIAIGTAATVLSAHIIAHVLDRLTGTTIATDLIYKYK